MPAVPSPSTAARTPRALVAALTALAIVTAALSGGAAPAQAAAAAPALTPAMEAAAACTEQSWDAAAERPAEHDVVVERDLKVPVSDGLELLGDLHRPDGEGPWPTIVTTTPYSKNALGPESYFPERGYAHLVVDVRGTGASQGTWQILGEREAQDVAEVVEWAGRQEWSTGDVGMYGASYLAITQLLGAARNPEGLRALFPIVPMADTYRDITFAGGQTNLAFIPLWMGLVTGTSLLPGGSWASDPQYAARALAEHLLQPATVQVPTIADGVLGGDQAYDGTWYAERSPINGVAAIDVPVFMTGGLNDIFQRGEPLLYERLKERTLVKWLHGPWGHVDGSTGAGLPRDGVPAYEPLAVAWFDRWVRGIENGAECLPDVTMYHWGSEAYEDVPDWPHPDLTPRALHLRADGLLTEEPPSEGEGADVLPQLYGNGLCSRSTSQWLMGAADRTPCQTDNRLTELAELTYTSEPFAEDVLLNGPIAARLFVSTTAREAVVVARLTMVSPTGQSRELSTGLLAASHRALDEERSRLVDGVNLQPWHPFTREAVQPVTAGEPLQLDIEIFPTAARIPAGWSLRLAIGTSDFPHAISPLPALVAQLPGLLTVLRDAEHPSSVAVPFVGLADQPAPQPSGAPEAPDEDAGAPAAEDDGTAAATTIADAPQAPTATALPATGGGPGPLALILLLGAVLAAALARRTAGPPLSGGAPPS
jgi:uncharacterized protein